MKRSGPLRRKSAMKRTAMKRKPRKPRPPEGPLTPGEWWLEAMKLARRKCAVTGRRVTRATSEVHHALRKSELRARGLYDFVWDPRNAVVVLKEIHDAHEGASKRIPASALPPSVWEFCRELDALDGTEWATEHVRRRHGPPR